MTSHDSVENTRGGAIAVEVLSFAGCPNREPAIALVAQIARELEIDPDVRVVDVEDPATAERLRFLGSPTIRVDGHDIEPGADKRSTYALTCRVYPTDHGMQGLPDPAWLREALTATPFA